MDSLCVGQFQLGIRPRLLRAVLDANANSRRWHALDGATSTVILARAFGDVAVMNGGFEATMAPLPDGTPERKLVGRALQVWAKREGAWQMIAFQATAVPETT